MSSAPSSPESGSMPAPVAGNADGCRSPSRYQPQLQSQPQPRPWLRRGAQVVMAVMAVGLVAGLGVLSRETGAVAVWDLAVAEHERVQGLVSVWPVLTAVLFVTAYWVGVTFSVPGAAWMTLVGGYLFGLWPGVLLVLAAATLGAVSVFLLARTAFRDAWSRRAGGWMRRMEGGFRTHAFSYLLVLRLIPVAPFWLVNLVPALLGVRLRTFVAATTLGIIPGTVIYVSLGAGVAEVAGRGQRPDLGVMWQPEILGPLVALAVLALVPVLWGRLGRGTWSPTPPLPPTLKTNRQEPDDHASDA